MVCGGISRHAAAEGVTDERQRFVAAVAADVGHHCLHVGQHLRLAAEAAAAFAVTAIVKEVAVVAKRGKPCADIAPMGERAGIAVEENDGALGIFVAEMQAVQFCARNRQADFPVRRGEMENVVSGEDLRVKEQGLLRKVECAQCRRVEASND